MCSKYSLRKLRGDPRNFPSENRMIIDRSPGPVLVAIGDPLEGISELDEYLLLVCDLLSAPYVDLFRRLAGWVRVVQLVRVILLEPVEGLLVLD